MKHLKSLIAVALLGVGLGLMEPTKSNAVIIEGFTPSGAFRTVAVSEDGRLLVASSSGTAQAVFFISSQPVNAFQATTPWVVQLSSPVEVAVGTTFTVEAATVSTVSSGQVSVNTGPTAVLSSNQARRQSVVCNQTTNNAWLGAAGVTTATGILLGPGACFSPDSPTSFVGSLFAVSTAPVVVGRIEILEP